LVEGHFIMNAILSAFSLTLMAAIPSELGEPAATDLARLQGNWTAKAGPLHDIEVKLEIEGHRARVDITTAQGLTVHARGEVKIDETSSPRALDWTKFNGLDHQELPEIRAIYALDGDTFTVCNGGPHGVRPTEFKAGDGVLSDIVVFKRLEPKPKTASDTRDSGSATAAASLLLASSTVKRSLHPSQAWLAAVDTERTAFNLLCLPCRKTLRASTGIRPTSLLDIRQSSSQGGSSDRS
jgi:uncharacterized protein (TIGR03067 family)